MASTWWNPLFSISDAPAFQDSPFVVGAVFAPLSPGRNLLRNLPLLEALWQLPLSLEERHGMFSRRAEAHQASLGER